MNDEGICYDGSEKEGVYYPSPISTSDVLLENQQLMKNKIKLDPESYKPISGVLARYGKKILDEGAKHYKRTTLEGLYRSMGYTGPRNDE